MAAERGMTVATKAESQEICFVAQNDYRGFINRYAAEANNASSDGRDTELVGAGVAVATGTKPLIYAAQARPIYDLNGNALGRHRGLAFYTIGQRKGLGLTSPEALHVLKIDAGQNALIVGPASALDQLSFTARENALSERRNANQSLLRQKCACATKHPKLRQWLLLLTGNRVNVTLSRPQRAITPGQAAVFYGGADGDEVLCGGIIE